MEQRDFGDYLRHLDYDERKAPVPITIVHPKKMREELIRRWHHLGGE